MTSLLVPIATVLVNNSVIAVILLLFTKIMRGKITKNIKQKLRFSCYVSIPTFIKNISFNYKIIMVKGYFTTTISQ